MPLDAVLRVVEYQTPTLLPKTGDSRLAGVTQIHGDVMPVADLRRELGFPTAAEPLAYVVAQVDEEPWALAVDQVERIMPVAIACAESEPSGYFAGAGNLRGKLVSVLSLASLRPKVGC